MNDTLCAHGCGNIVPYQHASAGGAYCDDCFDDGCLVGPDGVCQYTNTIEDYAPRQAAESYQSDERDLYVELVHAAANLGSESKALRDLILEAASEVDRLAQTVRLIGYMVERGLR